MVLWVRLPSYLPSFFFLFFLLFLCLACVIPVVFIFSERCGSQSE